MSWTDLTQLNTLVGWYKADAITGLNDGDLVSSWSQSGGLAGSITATLTERPMFRTNVKNGLPAVEFDGSNDRLLSGNFSCPGAVCMSAVFAADQYSSAYQGLLSVDSGPTYPGRFGEFNLYSGGTTIGGHNNGGHLFAWANQAGTLVASTYYVLTFLVRSPLVGVRRNGSWRAFQHTGPLVSAAAATTKFLVGMMPFSGGQFFDGKLCELVAWIPTNDDEHDSIEGYLAHKWAITLDSTHPYFASPPTAAPYVTAGFYNPFCNPVFGG